MSKRPRSPNEDGVPPSKRLFDKISNDDNKPGVIDLDDEPKSLIQNIETILEYQKKAIPYLYPSKKNNAITSLILDGLRSLDDRLQDAKKVKVSIATFGALGKGKSYLLNHVLKYNLNNGNEDLNLLPSGHGTSKTPVPVKIKYGPTVKVVARNSDKSEVALCSEKASLQEAASHIKGLFDKTESIKDLVSVDLVAPLPVFGRLKETVKRNCTYQDVEVEIEFVDLPGRGDNHGNALIGKELDRADIMLIFKNSESSRPVKIDDLKDVFERRNTFDYANRPRFVIICKKDEKSAQTTPESESASLAEEWRKLIDMQELQEENPKGEVLDSYKMIYKQLPLTTAKEFLQKFQEESKAIIFASKRDEFLSDLEETIIDHVNQVILKRNIHPLMQSINKDANNRKKRISTLISKEKKTRQNAKTFKPLGKLNFQLCLDSCGYEEFSNIFENDLSDLKLVTAPNFVKAHENMMGLFQQELTMQQLQCKLRSSLQEYYETLLQMIERDNGLFFSDESLCHYAHMSCERKVNEFMKQYSRDFIDARLKKLACKKPSRKVKKQWMEFQNDEEQRKVLLQDHFNTLVQHLSKLLVKGSRDDGLVKLSEDLRNTIESMIREGLNNDRCSIINDNDRETLENIKKTNLRISKYSMDMIRDVNPHLEPKKDIFNSKVDFPDPFLTFDEHGANVLPPISHTSRLKKVFDLLSKRKSGVLEELRKKLGLTAGSLPVPKCYDEFQWTRILLSVLQYDDAFHHMTLEDSLLEPYKVDEIPDEHLKKAKQQLFAYQKSNAKCHIRQDDSIPNDMIKISIKDNCLIALVSSRLLDELRKLESLSDPTKQLAPIFIPSIHYGPKKDELGNVYLEEDPWKTNVKDEDDNDDTTSAQQSNTVNEPTGLENLHATIFCVVEPSHLEEFQKVLSPPKSNISFRYVILPQNGRGIGVSRSIIKLLAESLKLPQYWTIDDDIKLIREFNKNSFYWNKCTTARALLYGQHVLQDCIYRVVNDIPEDQRYDHGPELKSCFPKWALNGRRTAMRLMVDRSAHNAVRSNLSSLNGQFSNEDMQKDCEGDPVKEREWLEAKEKYGKEFRDILLSKNYKRIGRVSIGHESGKSYGYYSRSDMQYRMSMQNYQMILHNSEAIKGFNYVPDDAVFQHEGVVYQPNFRDVSHLGVKWADKSFCKALEFYGIVGYQIITVVLSNEKLRDVLGRISNSYDPEPPESSDSDDEGEMESDCIIIP